MGWLDNLFGGGDKTVTSVGTQVSRVISDNLIPNSQRTGVFNAILSTDTSTSISDHILEEMATSMGMKADQLYRYGRDHYVYGLPSGKYISHSKGRSQVQDVLDALHGKPVFIDYCNYGPPNYLHIGWMCLVQDYGWNSVTNELTTLSAIKGVPVYLDNLEVVIPTAQASTYNDTVLAQWGPPATTGWTPTRQISSAAAGALRAPSHILLEAGASVAYVRATTTWKRNQNQQFGVSEKISITSPNMTAEGGHFHVRYIVDDTPHFWIYQGGSGAYPTLDEVYLTPITPNGTYFPFVYLRFNKHNDAADTTSQAYKSSKRITKYLGMDYATVCDAVNENPDIADVQQAMMMFAVPANTTNQLELKYLFDYFDTLYQAQDTHYQLSSQAKVAGYFAGNSNLNSHTVVIQDKRFKMALTHDGLFMRRLGGTIGAVGTYTMGTGSTITESKFFDIETQQETTAQKVIKHHFYRRQVTAGLYVEITVAQLQMLYYVISGYTVTADETDDILMIPLDQSITESYTLTEREELYARALYYVFNSVSVQTYHVSWYQTGLFQAVIFVVAVVIAVKTGQFKLIGAALAGDALAAVALLKSIVILVAFQEGMKLFVKAVGGDVAMTLAVIAAVVAVYKGYAAGSIKAAPWAKELLFVANGLSKQVASYYAEEIQNLMEDYSKTLDYQKQLEDELNTAQKLLEGDNIMSPFVIFGESPEDYFNRTAHSGNVGIVGIQAISNYVDNALKLPELHESITA